MTRILTSKIRPKNSDSLPMRVAFSHCGGVHPWATHVETISADDDGQLSTVKSWGRYFQTSHEAMRDYLDRCRDYGLEPIVPPVKCGLCDTSMPAPPADEWVRCPGCGCP